MKFVTDIIAKVGSTDDVTPDSLDKVDKDANKRANIKSALTLRDIPRLTKLMVQEDDPDAGIQAAKLLYELCDVAHKQNREPMVATGKYDVLNPLADCLLQKDNDDKLHYVCLTLNNLSVPFDNKRVMTLERVAKRLIKNLCHVISSGNKSAYLCLICLMNLAYYAPAEAAIGQFSPKTGRKKIPPLENPDSLLRILQELTAHAARGTSDFRWAFGLLAILAKHPENALLIGLTAIPKTAIENIRLSKTPPSEWKMNSLEDFSLFLILHLAQTSPQNLETVVEVIEPIMKEHTGGIQSLKATMICAFLGVPWSTFPNFGVNATGCISELMANTFERVGKKHSYDNNVFSLHTAVKAYGDLGRAAARADEDSTDTTLHTKVVALPTTVALLLQIIEYIVNQTTEDDDDHDLLYDHLDLRTGELAVMALIPLLPALLQMEQTPRDSVLTDTACGDVSHLFAAFARKTTSVQVRSQCGEAAGKIWESSKSALPLLEASYDLWKTTSASRK